MDLSIPNIVSIESTAFRRERPWEIHHYARSISMTVSGEKTTVLQQRGGARLNHRYRSFLHTPSKCIRDSENSREPPCIVRRNTNARGTARVWDGENASCPRERANRGRIIEGGPFVFSGGVAAPPLPGLSKVCACRTWKVYPHTSAFDMIEYVRVLYFVVIDTYWYVRGIMVSFFFFLSFVVLLSLSCFFFFKCRVSGTCWRHFFAADPWSEIPAGRKQWPSMNQWINKSIFQNHTKSHGINQSMTAVVRARVCCHIKPIFPLW